MPTDRLFEQLVEASPDAILVVDREGRIVMVNRQTERIFGYARGELVGQLIEVLIPERYRHDHVPARQAFTAAPVPRPMGSGRVLHGRRRDGHEVRVEVSLTPIRSAGRELVSATVRDITERLRLEEEGRRAAAYLLSAVESVADAFLLFDGQDRMVLVNSAARTLLGAVLDGPVPGRPYAEVLSAAVARGIFEAPTDGDAELVDRWMAYHRNPVAALDLRAPGGRTLRATERRTAEGGTVLVIADTTDDTRREDEVRRAHSVAEAASSAKSEFLSSMSHELRTPLNAVLGFAQLLQRDRRTPLTERQLERVAHVIRGGEHLLKLIDEILDLSSIESGRITISPESVALPPVIDEVRATLEPMAARAGIDIRIDPLPATLPAVRADRTRLAQILLNFGSNAVKYGRPGGYARFAVITGAESLRVSVEDDGIGIPTRHHGRMFEPFQRAGQEAGPVEGSGIGLAISKRLAELMGGAVGFTSAEGVGSTFWVEVPIQVAQLDSTRDVGPTGPPPAARTDGPRKLVVYIEDNPSNIAFMRELVEDLPGITLATAPTAEIGLELVRARRPAVVLMDVNLPGISGIEATRRLASWPETRHIPVVALSAAAMPRERVAADDAGFYRYLTKPVQVDELVAVLEELLSGSTGSLDRNSP